MNFGILQNILIVAAAGWLFHKQIKVVDERVRFIH